MPTLEDAGEVEVAVWALATCPVSFATLHKWLRAASNSEAATELEFGFPFGVRHPLKHR